jgi:CHASE2 domain-containing sensor protein
VVFGELLNGTLDASAVPFAPWSFTGKLTAWRRGLIWLLASQLWSIAICLIFAALQVTPQLIPLYLCALLPLLVVYCLERYQTLYSNYKDALEMRERHQVHANNFAKTIK